jgi:hypothetical protein
VVLGKSQATKTRFPFASTWRCFPKIAVTIGKAAACQMLCVLRGSVRLEICIGGGRDEFENHVYDGFPIDETIDSPSTLSLQTGIGQMNSLTLPLSLLASLYLASASLRLSRAHPTRMGNTP